MPGREEHAVEAAEIVTRSLAGLPNEYVATARDVEWVRHALASR